MVKNDLTGVQRCLTFLFTFYIYISLYFCIYISQRQRYISHTAISQYQEIKLIVKTTRRHMFDARTLHIILRFSLCAICDHHAAVSLYSVSTAVALIS